MFLKKFDLISPRITLFFEGGKRHSSVGSGLITLISIKIIIILSIIFLREVLFKKFPTSYYYNRYSKTTLRYEMSPKEIFHFLTFGVRFKVDPLKVKIIGVKLNQLQYFQTKEDESHIDHWVYEICSENSVYVRVANERAKNEYFKSIADCSYCISKFYNATTKMYYNIENENFIYPIITSGFESENALNYGIFILSNYTGSEYVNTLGFYTLHFIDNYVNVEEYHQPFISYFNNFSMSMSKNTFATSHVNFNRLLLRTDDGYFVNKIKEKETFVFENHEKALNDLSVSNKKIIGSFYFWIKKRANVHERRYKKIQDALSSIGGLAKVVTGFASIINYLFLDFVVVNDLNKFFEVDKNQKVLQKRGTIISLGPSKKEIIVKKDFKKCVLGKKLKIFPFIQHKFFFKRRKIIEWILSYRVRILSEEKILKTHLMLKLIKFCWKDNLKKVIEIDKITGYNVTGSAPVNTSSSILDIEKERGIFKIK